MTCTILGLGTAVPSERVAQEDALRMSEAVIGENPRQRRMLRTMYDRAGVESRHTAVSRQFGYEWKQRDDPHFLGRGPRTAERMKLFQELAPPLAAAAAARGLEDAGVAADEVTHLVTASCTGFGAPGVDVRLIQSLGLRPTTQRIHVGYMGCHGAINGLRAVRGLVAAEPKARVLMCAVELCSLHYRLTWDAEKVIGNALFADGAAALIATGDADDRVGLWRVAGTGSCLIPESFDQMSWDIGDHGFEMRLTSEVAPTIERELRPWIVAWLDGLGCTFDEVRSWAVHPGGPRILDAVQTALDLPGEATTVSRSVLRELGNMSSPTVLFILDRMRRSDAPAPIVALAFGPGLMAEAALLTR